MLAAVSAAADAAAAPFSPFDAEFSPEFTNAQPRRHCRQPAPPMADLRRRRLAPLRDADGCRQRRMPPCYLPMSSSDFSTPPRLLPPPPPIFAQMLTRRELRHLRLRRHISAMSFHAISFSLRRVAPDDYFEIRQPPD